MLGGLASFTINSTIREGPKENRGIQFGVVPTVLLLYRKWAVIIPEGDIVSGLPVLFQRVSK